MSFNRVANLPGVAQLMSMEAIIVTTDPVTISFAEAVLKDADIVAFVMDQHMSVLEPGIMIPKRLMVHEDDVAEARQALIDAGLNKELEKA